MNTAQEIIKLQEQNKRLKEKATERERNIEETNKCIKILYNELEKKNHELEKLDQMKSDFVSTVSHELRTPMTVVKESITQILDGLFGDISEGQKKILRMALNNIDRLARIINNLLDISKLEAGRVEIHKENINLVHIIEEICDVFKIKAKDKNLSLNCVYEEEDILVYADRDKIIQVFTNLVGNAIKFTEKGEIKLCLKNCENNIEIAIEDTGIGMALDDLPKVFDKFQQFGRKAGPGDKGTGLGLAICKNIIELHKGEIYVRSKEGAGSQFIFTLPKDLSSRPETEL